MLRKHRKGPSAPFIGCRRLSANQMGPTVITYFKKNFPYLGQNLPPGWDGPCTDPEILGKDSFSEEYLNVPSQRDEVLNRMRATCGTSNQYFCNVLDCYGREFGAKVTIELMKPAEGDTNPPFIRNASSKKCLQKCKRN